MTFLAQVALADVAPPDATASLPTGGHLVAFCDLEDPEMATARVLYISAGELVRRRRRLARRTSSTVPSRSIPIPSPI